MVATFNTDKCKVMHNGKHFNTAYFLQDDTEIKELASSHTERDLGSG